MKIFISHHRHTEYERDLYDPLRASAMSKTHEFILPHKHGEFVMTKDLIKEADMVFAEVSHSATGVGIEIGWADSFGKPIVCMYKKGEKLSNSLQFVTKDFIEYENSADLVSKLEAFLKERV